MKKTIITIALSTILFGCGGGSNSKPKQLEEQQPTQQKQDNQLPRTPTDGLNTPFVDGMLAFGFSAGEIGYLCQNFGDGNTYYYINERGELTNDYQSEEMKFEKEYAYETTTGC